MVISPRPLQPSVRKLHTSESCIHLTSTYYPLFFGGFSFVVVGDQKLGKKIPPSGGSRPSDMSSECAVAVPAVSEALSDFWGGLIFSTFGSDSRTFRRAAPLEDVAFMSGERRPLVARFHFVPVGCGRGRRLRLSCTFRRTAPHPNATVMSRERALVACSRWKPSLRHPLAWPGMNME